MDILCGMRRITGRLMVFDKHLSVVARKRETPCIPACNECLGALLWVCVSMAYTMESRRCVNVNVAWRPSRSSDGPPSPASPKKAVGCAGRGLPPLFSAPTLFSPVLLWSCMFSLSLSLSLSSHEGCCKSRTERERPAAARYIDELELHLTDYGS